MGKKPLIELRVCVGLRPGVVHKKKDRLIKEGDASILDSI
jgi:hypothetical protein